MLYIIYLALALSSAFLVEYSSAKDDSTDLHWIDLDSVMVIQSEEWRELVANKDAAGIAARYTEDCVLIVPGQPIARGRNNVNHWYKEILDHGLDIIDTDIVDTGRLGDDYVYMVVKSTTRDEKTGTQVEDGYQTFLDSYTTG